MEDTFHRNSYTDQQHPAWEPSAEGRPMYDGPDMPSTDLPEDHSGPEPQVAPLDLHRLGKIQGYESTGYHINSSAPSIPPPDYADTTTRDHHVRPEEQYSSVSYISEEEAREALLNYVSQKCCYGNRAARDMEIMKITPSCALHYTVETYTENRSTTWEQEPYKGQPVDGPLNGVAPIPWDIHCNPTQTFHDEIHHLEVPHTSSVTPCHGCCALGWIRCYSCFGRGFKRCISCHGSGKDWKTDAHGHRRVESCWHCHGTGRKRCFTCGGDGRIVCRTCQGYRQLKCYIKLKIMYKNHNAEQIIERTDMPEHLVKTVHGEIVFDQTQPRVWPIAHYPDQEICIASQQLINDHVARFQFSSRILMQRHRLQAVPVTECAFTWKDDEGRFWVYGKETAVYAPDYPQKYCWGCTIL